MARRLVVLLLVACAAAGCGVRRSTDSGRWLVTITQASGGAEMARARGDRAEARRMLVAIVDAPRPAGVWPDDLRAVRMDAYFRLATLELEDASPKAARQWAEQGLALGARRDVFTANLHLVHGRALEALGVDLEAQASYHRALVVTEALLGTALDK